MIPSIKEFRAQPGSDVLPNPNAVPAFGLKYDQFLVVIRERLAFRFRPQGSLGLALITGVDVTRYEATLTGGNNTQTQDTYFIGNVRQVGDQRTQSWSVGPVVVTGDRYVIQRGSISNLQSATYTVQPGDAAGDVATGVKAAFDSVFPTYTSSVNGNIFSVTYEQDGFETGISGIIRYTNVFIGRLIRGSNIVFATGRYARLNVNGNNRLYLLNQLSSSVAMPVLPGLLSEYDFDNLIRIPTTLESYLRIRFPLSDLTSLSLFSDSTTSVRDVPSLSVINSNECIIDEANDSVVFGTPITAGEFIKYVYK